LDNYDESDYIESEFYREEHIEYAVLRNRLKPGAVPSLFLDSVKKKINYLSLVPKMQQVFINETPGFICSLMQHIQ